MTQIQAGSSVESRCGKCKSVTDHHVVAMDGDQVAKVECKVCGARHAYKPAKAAASSAVATPKIRSSRPAAAKTAVPKSVPARAAASKRPSSAAWEEAVSGATPVSYDMAGLFRAGDVIEHAVFGLGAVRKFMRPNTIEVLFADGVRNLRCGGGR